LADNIIEKGYEFLTMESDNSLPGFEVWTGFFAIALALFCIHRMNTADRLRQGRS